MISKQPHYREILKSEFQKRLEKNPRYSLRAFSRDLRIGSARLSEILNGKSGLSRAYAHKVSSHLGFNEEEAKTFCDLVESMHGRSKIKREMAKMRLDYTQHQVAPYQNLQLDAFKIISEWYHLAILELTYLRRFKDDPQWIASQLGIQSMQAKLALERLKKLNLLYEKKEKWIAHSDFTTIGNQLPSEAIRDFHKQVLEKAVASLYTQSVEERDVSTIIMAINRKDLPQAKAWIQDFRRKFNQKLRKAKQKNSVYSLGLQFFRLNHSNMKEEQ